MEPYQCVSPSTYEADAATPAQASGIGLFQATLRFTQRSAAGARPRLGICYILESLSLLVFLFIPPLYSRELVATVGRDDDDITTLVGPLGSYTSHWKEVVGASGVVVMYVGPCLASTTNTDSLLHSCLLTVLQLSQVSENVLAKSFVLFSLALAFQSLCAGFAYYRMSRGMHTKEHGHAWQTVRHSHIICEVLPNHHAERSFRALRSCISPA